MIEKANICSDDITLLNDAIKYDIINLDSVNDMIMAIKLEKVAQMHPYAITPPASENGRWQTTYKDKYGKRKNIKASTREELLKKLIPIYFSQTHFDKLTFNDLFNEWIAYKATVVNSPNTIKRHRQHYNKYLATLPIVKEKIKSINELELESVCNDIVKSNNLTRKEWNNVKTILIGMYSFAIRKQYTTFNPMEKITIYVKYKQVVKKTGKTQTYNTEELNNLNQYLDHMFEETGDYSFLAVKFNFYAGLRVGELVALKWDDIQDNMLHVVREEVRDQTTNITSVVEHTKTNQDRFVFLVPKARNILDMIEHRGEYIFVRDGERLISSQINYVLRKYAERNGLPIKSSHKIRKTYASMLNANGVPLDCIREMLGHSDLTTTLSYIYNPLTEKETYDLITDAL